MATTHIFHMSSMSVAEMNKILAVDLIFLYLLFCFLETSACMSANEPLFIYLFLVVSFISLRWFIAELYTHPVHCSLLNTDLRCVAALCISRTLHYFPMEEKDNL